MSLALSNAPKKGALSNAPGNLGRDPSSVSSYAGDPDSEEAKWYRCVFGKTSVPDAIDLVKAKADPNCRFKYKLGPKEFDGTPLTLAVKLDKPALVRKLIDFKADPASEYSMSAGRLRVHWTGPAVCGTVAKGNLAMMRLLVECEANLQGRVISFNGEPNGTLLYDAGRSDALRPADASYFGHAHLVRYLLQQKGEPDLAVKFQDDMNITKTALQISSNFGHEEVVRVLLGAQAQISGPQELRDAIDGCHVEVVRLLVQAGADLFTEAIDGRTADPRRWDHAVPHGIHIQHGRETWGSITLEKDAEEILSAVFRKCELRYWQGEKRIVWKSAYILHGDMNVAVGPKKDQMDQQFHNQMQCLEKSVIPVEIWRSLLPGLHCEPEVLWVLASGLNERVFDEKGARAIIATWAERSGAVGFHHWRFTLPPSTEDLIAALLFWGLAFLLNDPRLQEPLYDPQWLRTVVLLILILIWSRNVLIEVMQIVMTGFSQIALATNWDKVQENQVLRIIFALTGFVRWLRVLNTLKGFESTGKPMLPILQAVPATVPFFFVVFCWFAGFMHMYYSFNLTDWWSSGMIMYRLGFLADFSRNELITGVDGDKRDSTDNVVIEDEKWITWAAGPFNASARVACIGARVCVATG
eukprot:g11856.t1